MTLALQALLLLMLWTCGPVLLEARRGSAHLKGHLATTAEVTQGSRQLDAPEPSLAPELAFLADVVGPNRLWVIVAPSRTDHYLLMMEQQIQDMEMEGLSCRLAARDAVILTVIQNAMLEGTLRRPSHQGGTTEQSLDPETVSRLLHHMELTEQVFSMFILKKNLQVSDRFPYPVRVEAVLEAIDQLPLRKLERLTGKAPRAKCKVLKKKMPPRKNMETNGFSSLRKGNVTVVARQHKPPNKQAMLRNKIQDILSGRSRFVIRKGTQVSKATLGPAPRKGTQVSKAPLGPAHRKLSSGETSTGTHANKESTSSHSEGTVKAKDTAVKRSKGAEEEQKTGKSHSKGKGKKKRGQKKKGKGQGKKSQRDTVDKDGKALKTPKQFLDKFLGKRRLLVISAPSKEAPKYLQQTLDNEQHSCQLSLRMITIVTILGPEQSTTLTLHHCAPGVESCYAQGTEESTNQDLISQLRKEYGLPSDRFSMVVTDYDHRSQKNFDSPIASPALLGYIDSLPSIQPELEREKAVPEACPALERQDGVESSLLRFVSQRRLLVISAPSEDDYSFQQQLQAMNGQACKLGIRHFALLKLIGEGPSASGSVELFPLNGRSQSENEPLSRDFVNRLRDQLKVSRDYFSMVVVDKGGDIKAWFPAPMWSLANVYDLVDSTELRHQEWKLQSTLGISCPEDAIEGAEDVGLESYLYSRSED